MSTEKHPQPSESQVIEFNLINLDPLIVQVSEAITRINKKYVLRTIFNSFSRFAAQRR